MGTSETRGNITGMAAILLRAICNESLSTGNAFRTPGTSAHIPMLMPPTHAAGIRAELFLFSARGMLQCAAALPACIFSRHCLSGRLYTIALAEGFDGVYRQAQFPGDFRMSQSLPALLSDQHFLSVCHTTSFAFPGIVGETSLYDPDTPDSQLIFQHAVHIAGQRALHGARISIIRWFLLQFVAPAVFNADLAEVTEQNRHATFLNEWHGIAQHDGLVHKRKRPFFLAGNQITFYTQISAEFIQCDDVHQEHSVLPV